MSDNVDEFLAHYGVPGMRWGRRTGETRADVREANRKTLNEAGQERLKNSGGSAAKANWKSIGKLALTNVVTNLGATAINTVAKNNPAVVAGTTVIGTVLQGVALGKTINEVRATQTAVAENSRTD